jgi:hypothetical protein
MPQRPKRKVNIFVQLTTNWPVALYISLMCIRARNVRKHVSFSCQSIKSFEEIISFVTYAFSQIFMQKYLQIPLLLIQIKIYSSKKQRDYMCVTFYSVTSGLPTRHYRWYAACKSKCRRYITKPQHQIQERSDVTYALPSPPKNHLTSTTGVRLRIFSSATLTLGLQFFILPIAYSSSQTLHSAPLVFILQRNAPVYGGNDLDKYEYTKHISQSFQNTLRTHLCNLRIYYGRSPCS